MIAGRALTALFLAVGLAACQSRRPAEELPEVPLEPVAAPAWIHQPLSWEKLETIEAWLEGAAADHDPLLLIEARLQLAEGRLLFTDRDVRRGTLPPETLDVRVQAALDGFAAVLADPDASPLQRQRAEDGHRRAAGLREARPAKTGLAVIAREEWGARRANGRRMTPLRGSWSRITVHHSAETSTDPNGGSLADSERALRLIQKFHLEDPGHLWGDIGYHFLIDSSGRIFQGRELEWQGAHAGGSNNQQNIGICLLGNFERESPRPAALTSLELLLDHLCAEYRIPPSRVYPHKRFGNTVCPGPDLTRFLRGYR